MDNKVWHKFWPIGMPKHIDYPVVPVGAVIKGSVRRFGDKTALVYHGQHYSYTSLYHEALKFANGLHDRGIGKGDVVAIHMPNCPQYVMAYYGIMLCGATLSPTNPLLPPRDLAHQLNDCEAVAVVTHEVCAKAVQAVSAQTGVRLVIVCGKGDLAHPVEPLDRSGFDSAWWGFHAFKESGKAEELDVSIDPKKDLAHLAYTGGTTGRSKGVMLTHYHVVVNTIQFCSWPNGVLPRMVDDGLIMEPVDPSLMGPQGEYRTRAGEGRLVNLTPWFHAMGTVGYLNNPILAGSTMILHDRFDPGAYLADAEKYQVTNIGGAPPIFVALIRHPDFMTRDLSCVRNINSGAAPLAKELLIALKERFPDAVISEGYGLTEVTMGAVSNPGFRSGKRKVGSVGIPVFGTEVKITPLDGGEEPLPPGEKGEICLRGPQVMVGYYKKPEETEAVLKDGWLHTGDIGFLDEEGYLFIIDRKKDMLIYKGYNVYPRELEELLFQHNAVANAAVVGKPVMEVGEIPKAYVVLKPGFRLTEEELMETINQQVVPYKKIRELVFVEEIPVSAAGKVLKRVLRDRELGS